MPYEIRKKGPKWVIVKLKKGRDGTESIEQVGSHDTEEQAKKQLAALKINVEDA